MNVAVLVNSDDQIRTMPDAWAESYSQLLGELRAIHVSGGWKELEDDLELWLWDRHMQRCRPDDEPAFWALFVDADGQLDLRMSVALAA